MPAVAAPRRWLLRHENANTIFLSEACTHAESKDSGLELQRIPPWQGSFTFDARFFSTPHAAHATRVRPRSLGGSSRIRWILASVDGRSKRPPPAISIRSRKARHQPVHRERPIRLHRQRLYQQSPGTTAVGPTSTTPIPRKPTGRRIRALVAHVRHGRVV